MHQPRFVICAVTLCSIRSVPECLQVTVRKSLLNYSADSVSAGECGEIPCSLIHCESVSNVVGCAQIPCTTTKPQIAVRLDVERAISQGMKFFWTGENQVIDPQSS